MIDAALDDLFLPYWWGSDQPNDLGVHPVKQGRRPIVWTPWPQTTAHQGGPDCSGFIRRILRRATGRNYQDRTANWMWRNFNKIAATARPGDFGFYGSPSRASHIVMALRHGGTEIIGANGGRPPTLGESVDEYAARMASRNAMVRIEDSRTKGYEYRNGFLGWRRAPGF